MEHIKDANLYIWLFKDNLLRLNLKQLLLSDIVEVKPQLEKVFSLGDTEYPKSMGFFVMDSKLHFLGGENLNQAGYSDRLDDDSFNKKVFSFNLPTLTPDLSTRFPCHSGNKCRPIVFTISNKVYALATLPFSFNLENVFEVFEPEVGEWRSLPPPPVHTICSIRSHCVFQNNLLLQTFYGDYIFNTNAEMKKWEPFDKFVGSKICALLEYKDHILVVTKDPFLLEAYELDSFYSSSAGVQLHIEKYYSDFSELNISWASFNIIENNYICLVFVSTNGIHVSLFRFITNDVIYGTCAFLEAYQEFDFPRECYPHYFPFYSTFLWCTKDEETPTAVSQLDTNRDRYLYISLGYDNLFSLNFNELCSGEPKLDLKLHHTNYKSGGKFPIGMGLFFSDSKLHFFGGENFEEKVENEFSGFYFKPVHSLTGLDSNVRPKYNEQGHGSKKSNIKCGEGWGNKKVFSFNLPDFTLVDSTLIPSHSSCSFRPLVFTISNKVYALSIGPLSIRFSSIDQGDEKLKLFSVYDLVEKKWRDLQEILHPELKELIYGNGLCIRSHCVFRNKLLFQTNREVNYLFKVSGNSGNWLRVDGKFPSIWASVEYNDKFLLVLTNPRNELVAYELESFGEENSTPPIKLYIYNNVRDVSRNNEAASLNLVDNNLINLVIVSSFDLKIHVMLLKVELPFQHAVVEVYRVLDLPKEFHGFYLQLNSTFIWQSEHDDTKARDIREKKRIQHDTE